MARGPVPYPRLSRRDDIVALRGIAVLVVVLSHAHVPGLGGGFLGVDVFFVLSGFLITALMLAEVSRTGRISLAGFYARRARRILPAATLVLVAMTLAATWGLSFVQADRVVRDVPWAALFAANVHLASQSTDYFAAGTGASPTQHFWSLAVEEQFYLVWPLVLLGLLALAARLQGRRPLTPERARRLVPSVALVVGLVCVASFGWATHAVAVSPETAYFSTFARAWEIGAGAALACALPHLGRLPEAARGPLARGGLVAVLAAVLLLDPRDPVPGAAALLPVAGTLAFLAAGSGTAPDAVGHGPRWLRSRPLLDLGDVSYSLYLWHWPVLLLGPALLGVSDPGVVLTGLLLVISFVAAWLSFHLVERPIHSGRDVAAIRWRASSLLLWPLAVTSVLAVTSWSTEQTDQVLTGVAGAPSAQLAAAPQRAGHHHGATPRPLPPTPAELVADAVAHPDDPVPFPLTQDLTTLSEDRWQGDPDCWADSLRQASSDLCPAGDPDGDRTVVLLGDSHAFMWLPGLDAAARRHHVRLVPITKFSCSPSSVRVAAFGPADDACDAWRSWALAQVRRLQPDAVVVGARFATRAITDEHDPITGADRRRAVAAGLGRVVAALGEASPEVRVLSDVQERPWAPEDCLAEPGAVVGDCTVAESPGTRATRAAVRQAVTRAGGRLVGLTDLFCHERACPTLSGRTVVFSDAQHVSAGYARAVGGTVWTRSGL